MNREEIKKKMEPSFKALLAKGIDPNEIVKNQLFIAYAKQFVDDNIDLSELVSVAEKINLDAGGKYSVNQTLEA